MFWPVAAFPVWFLPVSPLGCSSQCCAMCWPCRALAPGLLCHPLCSAAIIPRSPWRWLQQLPAARETLPAQSWLWRCLETPLAVLRGSRTGQVYGPFVGPVAEPCTRSPPWLRSSLPISPRPLLITNERRQPGTGAPSSSAQGEPRLQCSFLPPEEIIPRHLFISFPPTGFACFLFS